jgi:hypothetical protein
MSRKPADRKIADLKTLDQIEALSGTREVNLGPKELVEFGGALPEFKNMRLALGWLFEDLSNEIPSPGLLASVPSYLRLEPQERRRAAASLLRVLHEYCARSWWELLWCLAVDTAVPRKKGRRRKWLGPDGIRFIMDAWRTSDAMGVDLATKQGLSRTIAALQKADPGRYGKFSEPRLRAAYYDAVAYDRRVLKLMDELRAAAQSGNSAGKTD